MAIRSWRIRWEPGTWLADRRRSSRIILEANPNYREHFYDANPNADDAEGQAPLARFRGRKLPMIDRVEISIIEEQQPRWLSFLNKQQDIIERFPEEFVAIATPKGKLAPNLARQGIHSPHADIGRDGVGLQHGQPDYRRL